MIATQLAKFTNKTATMSSLEIAELVESRHDNVRISIERLASRGVIRQPPMQETEKINNLGLPQTVTSYLFYGEQGKRDSIVVVAQLSPEFTARLVDRWQELEEGTATPAHKFSIPSNLADALQLAADQARENQKLQQQIETDRPKIIFADAVEASKTSILVGDLAKFMRQNGVDIGQNRLFEWMRDTGWLMQQGESRNMPTQKAMDMGLFDVKARTLVNVDGSIRTTKTTKVTGKGQQYFINLFLKKLLPNNRKRTPIMENKHARIFC